MKIVKFPELASSICIDKTVKAERNYKKKYTA